MDVISSTDVKWEDLNGRIMFTVLFIYCKGILCGVEYGLGGPLSYLIFYCDKFWPGRELCGGRQV